MKWHNGKPIILFSWLELSFVFSPIISIGAHIDFENWYAIINLFWLSIFIGNKDERETIELDHEEIIKAAIKELTIELDLIRLNNEEGE